MSIEMEAPDGLVRRDSLYGEAEKVSVDKHHGSGASWSQTLHLAFQSIGVVYGDVGTSPLYVYSSTFPDGIKHQDDLLGVLSLILYTLILLPMLKYVFIVLYANDNGDGGTFALYSLISRYAKIRMIPNQQAEDAAVSNYSIEEPNSQMLRAQWVKQKLESSSSAKIALFTVTILGTAMVMGDGTLTPAISVLSAVSGIREKAPHLTQSQVVWISVGILFLLFSVQRFGTDKVGYSFAPIISVWFVLIAAIGVYNLAAHDYTVLRALNPKYIVDYFERNGKEAWVSLGGVVLCITGTEAMFADLGHFNIRAIQLSFTCILFPSVALCYMGQASYLRKFPDNVGDTFYKSIPAAMFWPTFIVAILAAIIASQAMLSGAFAILSKALSLGCFPRVEVVHTSNKYAGQVYIPEINFLIGAASIVVTIAFQTTTNIGNAYGICVVTVFSITTHLMTVVMLLIWKKHMAFIAAFYVVFGLAEFLYLSSILAKFVEGGYLPFCFSLVLMALMATWHYVRVKHYWYELDRVVPATQLTELLGRRDVGRVPGVGLLYSDLVQGIPPVFPRLVDKIPSVHAVFVFMSVKNLPIPRVPPPERFIFRRVGPAEHRMFRCVARYGYTDQIEGTKEFSAFLLERLKMFVQEEAAFSCHGDGDDDDNARRWEAQAAAEEEKRFIDAEAERGVVYLMGEANVAAAPGSSLMKKIVVNYVYTFLSKNLRESHKALSIPKDQLLKIGITYEI
ncbi:potassium transporter 19 [Brachypodium distachyon]|uniref:Potassium transporter n=2 Tax=Brachypodium distachyon TaxID=15368 RepID=A0A0Q3FJ27_BRADI|nr:potassium transporter 19 [Brachypodium distachyon]XP_024318366.1 potassium transporter 19 [Brachypodium distachyon]XP_024318367.1 potassium transporter 19 [Brachypodium distachyon]XP_024318368.1 potassium transporter 19 [Brachypodium distachyon]XP_024318369.1 potassium transporter 19 [Brachypodium distachyon]XP_024318370.1 potassium transporter 19 [Brachypodium distachyon]XP_024318371.1 potassium transporter 19 [Brachypodium distachyon]XP_024318372.1 potassium transporter 19 [Brachypodium|eukprot:XP_003575043.1 potassium transporter 19 [Brachypodium distachyon]